MKKQIRSARVFTLGFIGEAEVNEGSGDCLALGVGNLGETGHGCRPVRLRHIGDVKGGDGAHAHVANS